MHVGSEDFLAVHARVEASFLADDIQISDSAVGMA